MQIWRRGKYFENYNIYILFYPSFSLLFKFSGFLISIIQELFWNIFDLIRIPECLESWIYTWIFSFERYGLSIHWLNSDLSPLSLYSAHSPTARIIWWSKLMCPYYTRLNFAKSIAPMGTVHMEWDASSFTINLKPISYLPSSKSQLLMFLNQMLLFLKLLSQKNPKLKWTLTAPHLPSEMMFKLHL